MILLARFAQIEVTHPTVNLGGIDFDSDTLINSVIVCGILIGLALALRSQVHPGVPGRIQLAAEGVIDFIGGLVEESLGGRGINLGPLAISLFTFLLIANWIGLVPGFKSPTNDINTTLSLALMTFSLVQFYGIRARGIGAYLRHFVLQPPWFPLSVIEELTKPVTLTFRLYFNIFVGELLLALIAVLLPVWISWFPGVVWTLFSLFVGVVQAFIFTVLTVSYVAFATEPEEGH